METEWMTACRRMWKLLTDQDIETAQHSLRTALLCDRFGTYLGLGLTEIQVLRIGALLHDIGKLKVSAEILTKKGPLTTDEYKQVQAHPLLGLQILESEAPYLSCAAPYIRSHHERLDGTGYPDGLAESQIPDPIRMLTMCDSFDSMTASRGYREPLTKNEAIYELCRNEGQFDPYLVRKFVSFIVSL